MSVWTYFGLSRIGYIPTKCTYSWFTAYAFFATNELEEWAKDLRRDIPNGKTISGEGNEDKLEQETSGKNNKNNGNHYENTEPRRYHPDSKRFGNIEMTWLCTMKCDILSVISEKKTVK